MAATIKVRDEGAIGAVAEGGDEVAIMVFWLIRRRSCVVEMQDQRCITCGTLFKPQDLGTDGLLRELETLEANTD